MVVASGRSNKKGATNNILRLKDKNEKESGTIVETLHMITTVLVHACSEKSGNYIFHRIFLVPRPVRAIR